MKRNPSEDIFIQSTTLYVRMSWECLNTCLKSRTRIILFPLFSYMGKTDIYAPAQKDLKMVWNKTNEKEFWETWASGASQNARPCRRLFLVYQTTDSFSGALFAAPVMGILIGSVQRRPCSVAVLQPLGSSSVAAGLQNPAFRLWQDLYFWQAPQAAQLIALELEGELR